MVQRIALLGATGSIGASALEVIARHPDRFKVAALTAHQQDERLHDLIRRYQPAYAVIGTEHSGRLRAALAGQELPTRLLEGPQALEDIARSDDVDVVITGIVGAAGLGPTLAAVSAGKRVLIANKEPLVMLGSLLLATAQTAGATVLPIDSEHNAVFQCLPESTQQEIAGAMVTDSTLAGAGVTGVTLTASGGPFLRMPAEELAWVTPTQAAAHPNWQMGQKISVDSASLMNKGLELIEACVLFGLPSSQVNVLIHPQSIVHSLVEFSDGSVLAQMAKPDMRIPIANALTYPERIASGAPALQLQAVGALEFEEPDPVRFPCLRLAKEAARAGGTAPAILNAANEIAVAAFSTRQLLFPGIAELVERVLQRLPVESVISLDQVVAVDQMARNLAKELISSVGGTDRKAGAGKY
ncbi:MAG: 1-deoxy-D-xylulose-5-phosphate reductoisomerase [Arenicellales bacterium]|jgi:1-deoxy-D-xylulose-5-phosphate reductoisomerase|nr:1-deoxy-D-xylulose-5-phosphate reductoisomerase [Arenicellales bacterium]